MIELEPPPETERGPAADAGAEDRAATEPQVEHVVGLDAARSVLGLGHAVAGRRARTDLDTVSKGTHELVVHRS